MERVSETLVYEYWDCAYCGETAIRGDHESCRQCGHARDAEIRFYRLADREETVEAAASARYQAGSDWICAFCGTLNDARGLACRFCRGSKASSEATYLEREARRGAAEAAAKGAPAPSPSFVSSPSPTAADGALTGTYADEPAAGPRRWPYVVVAIAVLLVGVLVWATRTHPQRFEVVAVHWQRSIPVERYQWLTATDWENELKGDGIVQLESTRMVHHTVRQQMGTKEESYTDTERHRTGSRQECSTSYQSLGNGASRKVERCRTVAVYETRKVTKKRTVPVYENVPVYRNKVRYKAKRFELYRTLKASGADNQPRWPELSLGKGAEGRRDREGKRRGTYRVELRRVGAGRGPELLSFETTEARFTTTWLQGKALELPVSNIGRIKLGRGDRHRRR